MNILISGMFMRSHTIPDPICAAHASHLDDLNGVDRILQTKNESVND